MVSTGKCLRAEIMYQQDFLFVRGTLDLEWLETEKKKKQYMGLCQKPLKAINEIIFCPRESVFFLWARRINGDGNSVATSIEYT